MVILVGDKLRLGGIGNVIETRLNENIINIEPKTSIKEQENDILAYKDISYVVYDIDQYFDEATELIETIKRIQRTNKAKPILYVQTDNPKNEIIKNAVAKQVKFFVNEALSLGEQKDQVEKILSGYYEANGREDIEAIEEEINEDNKTLNDFVTELYDAKQREIERETTVIIKKKGKLEVLISAAAAIIRVLFNIITIILAAIGILALIYTEPREALIKILNEILIELHILIGA